MNLTCIVVDGQGQDVAVFDISDVEDGWYYGNIVSEHFSRELRTALEWYDEVISGQMLSFVDESLAAIDRFQLGIRQPNGSVCNIYSLHVMRDGKVEFRITPIPPVSPN